MGRSADLVAELRREEVDDPIEIEFFKVLALHWRTEPPQWHGYQFQGESQKDQSPKES